MVNMDLLKLKRKMNAKRPKFKHYDHQKRREVNPSWRRPRGLHNKMRKGVWGRPASVNVGYRTPVEVRGMHYNSLFPVIVNTLSDIAGIDIKTQGALIAHVGGRTRRAILLECRQKKVSVFYIKGIDEEIKKIDNKLALRKEIKKNLQKRRLKEKSKEVKEEKKEAMTKEQENKEMQKLVTQRS